MTERTEKQGHFIGTAALLMDDELGKAGVEGEQMNV